MSTNTTGLRDPVTSGVLNGAHVLHSAFARLLPADLTVDDPMNVFHHTGTPTNINAGDIMTKQPWKSLWKAAGGTRGGKGAPGHGRRAAQRYERHVDRFINTHMFANGVD